VISFFWGLDRVYPALGPPHLFLADDYRENFASIVKRLDLPANPSLYLHAPGRLDPGMAPPGEDTLIAIVPVGHINEHNPQDWAALIHQARRAVFRRLSLLGITDLEAHIKFETVFAPPSWLKRYNLSKGATHGLLPQPDPTGLLAPRQPPSALHQPLLYRRQYPPRHRHADRTGFGPPHRHAHLRSLGLTP